MTRPPPPRSFMRAAVSDLSRLGTIANVLVRHGFTEVARRAGLLPREPSTESPEGLINVRKDPSEAARRLRCVLEDLGPTFVKVGQILSTRRDLLPQAFIDELSKLQDQVPPMPAEDVEAAVSKGLGRPLDEAFAWFDPEPLASASIAETHLARLHSGEEVVVKVQRPGIAETIRSDLDLLFLFARFLEATIEEMELYAPGDLVRALDDGLSMELDFVHEAGNLAQFAENFAEVPGITVPALFESHSTRTILTMGRVRGRKVAELDLGGEEAKLMAGRFIEALYLMIFEHGVFHADPHPGNCFVTDEGELAFIDFGLCGYLSPSQQDQLVTLIVSVVSGDVDGIARILLRMGRPLGHVDLGAFKAEVSAGRDRYLRRSLKTINVASFSNEVLDAAQRYRIRLATEYALLGKAGATIDGIVRTLDPEYDIIAAGRAYARRMLAQRYSPERLTQEAFSGVMTLSTFLREVPDQLSQILMDAETGTLQLKLRNKELEDLGGQINTLTTRLFMGLCCGALTVATPLFLATEPLWFGPIPVATAVCAGLAVLLYLGGMSWHLFAAGWGKLRISPILKFIFRRR